MRRIKKIAIIGFGSRGHLFADFIKENNDVELVAVVDVLDVQLEDAVKNYNINPKMCFKNYKDFYKLGKVADGLIIATQDKEHLEHILPAFEIGYDILLEKPAATTLEDCLKIKELAHKYNRKVMICHVLRYTHFFSKIKQLIDNNLIGDIVNINLTENVGYWHQAHSFVRGAWRNKEQSSPMILAKCCHDLDIIASLINKKCTHISSFGGLYHFKKENAPEKSAEWCVDCSIKDECPFNCFPFYRKYKSNILGSNSLIKGRSSNDVDEILSSKENNYGRCVYQCDNNVVDHQIVNMQFEGAVTAHLTMTAFSDQCYRKINIHGTMGEIYGILEENKIYYSRYISSTSANYTGFQEMIDLTLTCDDFSCHGGGDKLLLEDFLNLIDSNDRAKALTTIDNSIMSHLMCFAAEKSRLENGKVVFIDDYKL